MTELDDSSQTPAFRTGRDQHEHAYLRPSVFGLPWILSATEAELLRRYLTGLWTQTYGTLPSPDVHADIEQCRRFFDPRLRGQSVRTALGSLPETDPPPPIAFPLHAPVLISVDSGHRLIGVEGRLLIDLLGDVAGQSGYLTFNEPAVLRAVDIAARTYREWASFRLHQTIALGHGGKGETLQAKAVGLVLGFLINRSTSVSRAVVPDPAAGTTAGAERAIFLAAEAFAKSLVRGRERSSKEDRLKGGYAVTEARRRLQDFIIDRDAEDRSRYYLVDGSAPRVINQLADELSKRERLESSTVAGAFDHMVEAYRAEMRENAYLGGMYERPSDTAALRTALLKGFEARKASR